MLIFRGESGLKKAEFFDENAGPRKAVFAMKLMLMTRCSATRKWGTVDEMRCSSTRKWGTVDEMVAVSLASEVLLMGWLQCHSQVRYC